MSSLKLNPSAFAKSAALVWAFGYTVCAASVALAPTRVASAFSFVMHIDLTRLGRAITWGSYAGGLLISSLVIGLYALAIAALYNWMNLRCAHEGAVAGSHACCGGAKNQPPVA